MSKQKNSGNVEGGSPSRAPQNRETKQINDTAKPSKTLKKEAISKSEKGNMTGKKGYNETPGTVPVKSAKSR
ncbi:hypothetical protein [Dyadobacter helix]|nr:hypothetical protein [Dyadobacter sp. CECT 9275]